MSLYLGDQKIQNISVGLQAVGVDTTGLNSETTTSFNGIIKGENGKATTAVPGTDYLAPDALNSLGSLANKSKVSESDLDDALKQTIQNAGNIQLPEGIVQNNIVNTFTADGKITMAEGYTPTNDGDIANKKWVEQQVKSAVPAFSNGPLLFEESGTFNPASYNLTTGDQLQVICIGGGGGGGGCNRYNNSDYNIGKNAGTVTTGDYGCGAPGGSTSYSWNDGSETRYGVGGYGGGGFLKKATITLESASTIPITIGQGGVGTTRASSRVASDGTDGGATSFGTYLTAEGGGGGKVVTLSEKLSEGTDRGTPGASGTGSSAGWTVKSYIEQTSEPSNTHKGSGAVFIWY